MMARIRRIPIERKAEILDHAILVARTVGFQNVTREAIAESAQCSPGLVSRYFGTMRQLRRAIMSAALVRSDLIILAQGLVAGEAKAKSAPEITKRAALEVLL